MKNKSMILFGAAGICLALSGCAPKTAGNEAGIITMRTETVGGTVLPPRYSTVTDLARLRGWSTFSPRLAAM